MAVLLLSSEFESGQQRQLLDGFKEVCLEFRDVMKAEEVQLSESGKPGWQLVGRESRSGHQIEL